MYFNSSFYRKIKTDIYSMKESESTEADSFEVIPSGQEQSKC